MNGEDKKLLEEIFKPTADKVAEMQTDIAVIKIEQDHQGDYIEALQGDVRGLHDKVDTMPDTWRTEIGLAVSDCRDRRDKITETAEKAEEKVKGEITGVANLVRERERIKRDRSASLIPASTKNLFVKLLPYIIIGLACVGAWVTTKAAGPDADDLDKALEAIERVEAQVVKLNGAKEEEEAGEGD